MTATAPQALATAAAARAVDAEQQVRRALRDLDREGVPIRFAAVSARARVSRSFLYRNDTLRREIERLRGIQIAAPSPLPVRERGSDASVRTRLRAALEENRRQREEISALRDELALVHGRVRELELDRRTRR